jgi:hypothetical protein
MLWGHIQPLNPHLAHTMTKVERHGGQLELGIFRVAHHQERVLLPLRDSMGGSDVTTALTDHACDHGRVIGLIGLILAFLYGPAARCKPKVTIWRSWVLRFCIRPLTERLSSWPSWISARARSHSRLGPEGHKGHLITNALARPFLHLLISTRRPRRETTAFGDQPEPSPRSHRRSFAQ